MSSIRYCKLFVRCPIFCADEILISIYFETQWRISPWVGLYGAALEAVHHLSESYCLTQEVRLYSALVASLRLCWVFSELFLKETCATQWWNPTKVTFPVCKVLKAIKDEGGMENLEQSVSCWFPRHAYPNSLASNQIGLVYLNRNEVPFGQRSINIDLIWNS